MIEQKIIEKKDRTKNDLKKISNKNDRPKMIEKNDRTKNDRKK